MSSTIASILAVSEGILSLFCLTVWSYAEKIRTGLNQHVDTAGLATASEELWGHQHPADGLQRRFLTLHSGTRLHYICSARHSTSQDLIIFLHGFPDSCHLWGHMLKSDVAGQANLVSMDLPGYGGSDGLSRYGPNEMLSTVQLAIEELKEVYGLRKGFPTEGSGQCIVVGHDWGGIIASRLAAGSRGLIDHLVLVNSLFPVYFRTMIHRQMRKSLQILSVGPKSMSYTTWLISARDEAAVAFSQLLKSHYVFMLGLPFFSPKRFPSAMQYIISTCHKMADSEHKSDPCQLIAASLGPCVTEHTESHVLTYGTSVLARAMHRPSSVWDERVRLYQEGLMSEPWLVNEGPRLSGEFRDESRIKSSVTVIFGLKDQAVDSRLAVNGIHAFVQPPAGGKGFVYLLNDVAHWSPLNSTCSLVLERILLERVGDPRAAMMKTMGNGSVHEDMRNLEALGKIQIRELL